MRGRGLCKQQNCTPLANPLDSFRVVEQNKNILYDQLHALTASSALAAKRFEAIAANLK
jgi:hypothetical protein